MKPETRSPTPNAPIRAVFIDMDGTLITRSAHISPRVLRALQAARAKGVEIIPATGRTRYTALHVSRQIVPLPDYLITSNGGLVMEERTGTILSRRLLPIPLALQIINAMADAEAAPYVFEDCVNEDIELSRALYHPRFPAGEWAEPPRYRPDGNLLHTLPFSPISVSAFGPPEQIRPLTAYLREILPDAVSIVESGTREAWGAEVYAAGVDKRLGLEIMARKLGIAHSETMAIGDHMNDLGMLRWAGIGVAMGNAIPEVLEAADEVTSTAEEDGVALALEKWIL